MQTNYQKINTFDVAVVSMIAIGFILVGVILFTSLTPRGQSNVATAFKMFDVHEQAASTVKHAAAGMELVLDIPDEFYNQFYFAFTQVAVLPPETFEVPVQITSEIYKNVSVVIDNLGIQAAQGYAARVGTQTRIAHIAEEGTELAMENYEGKVLGALTDPRSKPHMSGCSEKTAKHSLIIPYGYDPPDLVQLKLSLINLIKK